MSPFQLWTEAAATARSHGAFLDGTCHGPSDHARGGRSHQTSPEPTSGALRAQWQALESHKETKEAAVTVTVSPTHPCNTPPSMTLLPGLALAVESAALKS